MVKSAVQPLKVPTTDGGGTENRQSTMSSDTSFDISSFELVRQFVEHVAAENASAALGTGDSYRNPIDWETVTACVADSDSLEQAIGRAVVIADLMCRGAFIDTSPYAARPAAGDEEAFFAFSVTDVVPDFGDESRYRTKVAKRMARVFGIHRPSVGPTAEATEAAHDQ